MRFIKNDTNINFMGFAPIAQITTYVAVLLGLFYWAYAGLNYGIDFRGGTVVQVKFDQRQDISAIRASLTQAGFDSFSLQALGQEADNEFLVSLSSSNDENISAAPQAAGESAETPAATTVSQKVENTLKSAFGALTIRRVESVGPKVGDELKWSAIKAVVLSLILIMGYVAFRFEWRYGVGAIIALTHDVLFVVGVFAFTQKEMTITVLAAILTVGGYSINDTIVIMDRIRDNLRRSTKTPLPEAFNKSINETLSRTIITSGTTLLAVLALFLWGGEIIHDFAFALLVGITAGTYSSICVASPTVLQLTRWFPPKVK
ncbi:MAG: protein translocase subunit SecF [Deltaproteobacteria bacterium]|nr:protein translocase subunit SecF [Deltaproteobacteria bacterium]